VIADGEVVASGSPEVLRSHASARIQQFMNGSPDGPVPFHYPADELEFDLLGNP